VDLFMLGKAESNCSSRRRRSTRTSCSTRMISRGSMAFCGQSGIVFSDPRHARGLSASFEPTPGTLVIVAEFKSAAVSIRITATRAWTQ
jgi:hypothetical protein